LPEEKSTSGASTRCSGGFSFALSQDKARPELRLYVRQKREALHPENFEDYEQAVGEGYAAVGGL
jgi:hypothetical protein